MQERAPKFESPTAVIEVQEEKSKLKHEEIEDLREPIKNILDQMRERIDKGEYTHIIGDDASGRIPTLIFGEVLGEIYEKGGYVKPEIKFLAGSGLPPEQRNAKLRTIMRFLEERILKQNKKELKDIKILIVTDTLSSGNTLKLLAEALMDKALRYGNVDFDIATIGLHDGIKELVQEREKRLGHPTIFFGHSDTPQIYHRKGLSGVQKDPQDLHAMPYHYETKDDRAQLKESRKDAHLLSQDLVRWYKRK